MTETTTPAEWIATGRALADAAHTEITRLALASGGPGTAWCWSIPARPERDSDLLLSAPLPHLDRALDALDAVLAPHRPVRWHECDPETEEPNLEKELPPFCAECSDPDEVAAVEGGDVIDLAADVVCCPCPTVRAITAALAGATS